MSSDDAWEDPEERSTVARPAFDPVPLSEASFTLTVVEGPDAGQSYAVESSELSRVLLGVGPACSVRLSDRQVSRRHAAIEIAGSELRVTDLGSTNGTFIDGARVLDGFVSDGGTLRVGATALRVALRTPERRVALSNAVQFGRVIGASAEMRRIYPLCKRLAMTTVPVIIEGETGTGKEVLAESLHEEGPRASGPFVVFDCTAVAPNLLEAELFGHERGAFTGALAARRGVFEQANGGTLLIDEIGDLDVALQPKLLRAIERSEVRRIGGERPIVVDVRILAATRRDLDHEVAAGRFRDDLFHRLAVARIELPPLARRRGDVAVLARHFVRILEGSERMLPDELLRRWNDYRWPGNVRELRNAVARLLAIGELDGAGSEEARDADHPASDLVDRVLELDLPLQLARQKIVEDFEHRYIERILAKHDGSVARAAAASGIARRHFRRLKAARRKS